MLKISATIVVDVFNMGAIVNPSRIVKAEWQVEQRLSQLGTSRAELVKIAERAAAARADSTEDDPVSAGGLLSWIYGTRALRKVFRPKGWKRNRADNIESVVNKSLKLKFIFQNGDSACDDFVDPQSISSKKVASERLVKSAQQSIFPEWERDQEETQRVSDVTVFFYYFVAVDGEGEITSELSCPRDIENGQFKGFHERIFIVNKGDLDAVVLPEADPDQDDQDFDVIVTRKN